MEMDPTDKNTLVALIIILALFAALCFCFRCLKSGFFQADASLDQMMLEVQGTLPMHQSPATVDLSDPQSVEDRRLVILTSVIHKKAVSKSDSNPLSEDSDDLILPHVEDVSTRKRVKKSLSESPIKEESMEDDNDDYEILSKDDIRVESLQIIRSTREDLVKQLSSGEISTFYSPKSCPICLERYTKGDDICWSRNKKCHHAYHLECILEWLMHSNECPLCRVDYLNQSTESVDEESL